jgi:uncharacterized membrane protein YhaH (DUF805 family)
MASSLFLPFFFQVALPCLLLGALYLVLNTRLNQSYSQHGLDEDFFDKPHTKLPHVRRLRDITLSVRLLILPLLVLLFFNFQNTLSSANPQQGSASSSQSRSLRGNNQDQPSNAQFSQASGHASGQNRSPTSGLTGNISPLFGTLLLSSLLLGLLQLICLRLHPLATYPITKQPLAFLQELKAVEQSKHQLKFLQRFFHSHIPLSMVIQLSLLPAAAQFYLNLIAYAVALGCLFYSLLQLKKMMQKRHHYLELLLQSEASPALMHWKSLIARRLHDQEKSHKALLKIALSEHKLLLNCLSWLLFSLSALAYQL